MTTKNDEDPDLYEESNTLVNDDLATSELDFDDDSKNRMPETVERKNEDAENGSSEVFSNEVFEKLNKLDTINESISEMMQSKIRKASLNVKNHIQEMNEVAKPNVEIKEKNPNPNIRPQNVLKETQKRTTNPTKMPEKQPVTSSKPISIKGGNRCQSSDKFIPNKPGINLELFNPTANKSKANPLIVVSSGVRPKQVPLSKPTSATKINPMIPSKQLVPNRIDSSRIESNKKQANTITSDSQSKLLSADLKKIDSPRKQSEKSTSSLSSLSLATVNRLPSAASDPNQPLGQPSQPIIYDMFADYPQPYTFINDLQNEESLMSKKMKAKRQKKNLRSRTTSAKRSGGAGTNTGSAGKQRTVKTGVKKVVKAKDLKNCMTINACLPEEATIETSEIQNPSLNAEQSFLDKTNCSEYSSDEETVCSLKTSIGLTKSDAGSKTQRSLIDQSHKNDLVQSVADKVDAIYKKYNDLITQQERRLNKSGPDDLAKEFSAQKANLSEELAGELNINFDELTSNPELIKRLRNMYVYVKESSSALPEIKSTPPKVKPREKISGNESLKMASPSDKDSHTGPSESFRTDWETSRRNSVRSQADIREIFSKVGGVSRSNSVTERDPAEMTFPPPAGRFSTQNSSNSRTIKIPAALTEKINTLMFPFQSNENPVNESKLNSFNDDTKTVKNFKPNFNFVSNV